MVDGMVCAMRSVRKKVGLVGGAEEEGWCSNSFMQAERSIAHAVVRMTPGHVV